MSSEKFCLKWNDFERNISLSFREIREENDFFDVTLACDDKQIRAHKLILSACSPFFKDVLRKNPHQHPLLYLRGIKFRDIQSILQFMYHGEVNVAQEDLNSFLSISEELKVKGLTQGENVKSDQGSKTIEPPPREQANIKRGARTAMSDRIQFQSQDEAGDDDIEDVTPIKTEPSQETAQGHEVSLGDGYDGGHYQEDEANYDYGQYQEEEGSYSSVDASHGNKGGFSLDIMFLVHLMTCWMCRLWTKCSLVWIIQIDCGVEMTGCLISLIYFRLGISVHRRF